MNDTIKDHVRRIERNTWLTAILALFVVLAFGTYYQVSSKKKWAIQQADFISFTVRESFLNGNHAQLYQQCKSLASHEEIYSLSILKAGTVLCEFGRDHLFPGFKAVSHLKFDPSDELSESAGLVILNVSSKDIIQNVMFLIFISIVTLIVSSFSIRYFFNIISQKIVEPILLLVQILNTESDDDAVLGSTLASPYLPSVELQTLYNGINDFLSRKTESYKEETRRIQLETEVKISRQLAHDIRSPLEVINSSLAGGWDSSESHRQIIASAIERINILSDALLNKGESPESKLKAENISKIVAEIVAEKKAEYAQRRISFSVKDNTGQSEFVNSDSVTLKRILSNLINNSVESYKSEGEILIYLDRSGESELVIKIQDHGCGIPNDILSKLGNEIVTFGKENISNAGSGIGFLHASETIKGMGGTLQVSSILNQGSTVVINLPRFTDAEEQDPLKTNSLHVLIDNDLYIRLDWQKKAQLSGAKFLSFKSLDHFKQCASTICKETSLIYIDYHLGTAENGIDIAVHLKEQGFKHLYLASAIPQKDCPPWLNYIGKSCPF